MKSRSLWGKGKEERKKGGKIIIYSMAEIAERGTGSIFGRGLDECLEGLRESHQSFIHGTEFEVMNESCERYDVAPPAFCPFNAPSILIEDLERFRTEIFSLDEGKGRRNSFEWIRSVLLITCIFIDLDNYREDEDTR